jgi:hypothetical protein
MSKYRNRKPDVGAMRRCEIERIARIIDVADTDDFRAFLVAWLWHNPTNIKDPAGALMFAANRMGGNITEEQAELVIHEAATTRQRRKADPLAHYLRITDKIRTATGTKTIGSIDVSKRQRVARRRAQRRVAEQSRRRAAGAKPRSESLSRTKPWEKEQPPTSRRAWYRRQKAKTEMAQIRGQSPLSPTKSAVAQIRGQSSVSTLATKLCHASKGTKARGGRTGVRPAITARTEPVVFVESAKRAPKERNPWQGVSVEGAVSHVPCGTNETAPVFVHRCHDSQTRH